MPGFGNEVTMLLVLREYEWHNASNQRMSCLTDGSAKSFVGNDSFHVAVWTSDKAGADKTSNRCRDSHLRKLLSGTLSAVSLARFRGHKCDRLTPGLDLQAAMSFCVRVEDRRF